MQYILEFNINVHHFPINIYRMWWMRSGNFWRICISQQSTPFAPQEIWWAAVFSASDAKPVTFRLLSHLITNWPACNNAVTWFCGAKIRGLTHVKFRNHHALLWDSCISCCAWNAFSSSCPSSHECLWFHFDSANEPSCNPYLQHLRS